MKEASLSLPVRRALLRIVGSAAMPLGVAPAVAQGRSFPDRPIRMIVPWPPGGVTDVQMRALCEQAARRLGQPIVVENRPGATGSLGAVALKDGRPDGYDYCVTFLLRLRYGTARQHGHRGRRWMRATAMRRRTDAMECGTWRSGRIGGAAWLEAFG